MPSFQGGAWAHNPVFRGAPGLCAQFSGGRLGTQPSFQGGAWVMCPYFRLKLGTQPSFQGAPGRQWKLGSLTKSRFFFAREYATKVCPARSRVSFPTVCFRNDTTPPPLDYSLNSRGRAFATSLGNLHRSHCQAWGFFRLAFDAAGSPPTWVSAAA